MSMEATQQLVDEHQGVGMMLSVMGRIAGRLQAGERVNPEHFDRILEFLTVFVDKCHHGKEEDEYFPALRQTEANQALIDDLLREHELGRGLIQGLSMAVEKYKKGDDEAASEIIRYVKNYDELLSRHIVKENSDLFIQADKLLSPETQHELFEKFEKIEEERIGTGKHEQFHQMLEEFKDTYIRP